MILMKARQGEQMTHFTNVIEFYMPTCKTSSHLHPTGI